MNSASTAPVGGRVLVAGIGNIFLGDDAFGVEVTRELAARVLPAEVRVLDFGIRSYDLAYALSEGYETAILVDACARGELPGTVFLIRPDLSVLPAAGAGVGDAHSMDPVVVLQMAKALGELPRDLYLVGCEPAVLESSNGEIGLSPAVRAAVPQAISLIQSLLARQLNLITDKTNECPVQNSAVALLTLHSNSSGLAPA